MESHGDRDGRGAIVFITVCTRQRRAILAQELVHSLLVEAWEHANEWAVGRYVIMPDHVHLFCRPKDDASLALKKWVSYWKSQTSKGWPKPRQKPVWQASFWDRDLRSVEAYESQWRYVVENPVRHGLVKDSREWPLQGELRDLEW
ncbi:MAG: transposase [Verrucomicrobiota bacterium]